MSHCPKIHFPPTGPVLGFQRWRWYSLGLITAPFVRFKWFSFTKFMMDSFPCTIAIVHYWLKSALTTLCLALFVCLFFDRGRCPESAFAPSLRLFNKHLKTVWVLSSIDHIFRNYISLWIPFSLAALLHGVCFLLYCIVCSLPTFSFQWEHPRDQTKDQLQVFLQSPLGMAVCHQHPVSHLLPS